MRSFQLVSHLWWWFLTLHNRPRAGESLRTKVSGKSGSVLDCNSCASSCRLSGQISPRPYSMVHVIHSQWVGGVVSPACVTLEQSLAWQEPQSQKMGPISSKQLIWWIWSGFPGGTKILMLWGGRPCSSVRVITNFRRSSRCSPSVVKAPPEKYPTLVRNQWNTGKVPDQIIKTLSRESSLLYPYPGIH